MSYSGNLISQSMIQLHRYCFAALITAAVCSSCEKENEEPDLDEKTKALVSQTWKVSAHVLVEKKPGQPDTIDSYATYPAWARDNTYRFYPDNTFEVDEGSVRRQSTDPQKVKGIWRFESDQQAIAIGLNKVDPLGTSSSRADNSIVFELFELTTTKFRFGCGSCSPQTSFKTLTPK